jgi:26S proteasome non-ATPase regulatory subunit 9
MPFMENLHAPTVPSGPTSGPATDGNLTAGLSFAQLQAKKDNLEAELRALSTVLESVCANILWMKRSF